MSNEDCKSRERGGFLCVLLGSCDDDLGVNRGRWITLNTTEENQNVNINRIKKTTKSHTKHSGFPAGSFPTVPILLMVRSQARSLSLVDTGFHPPRPVTTFDERLFRELSPQLETTIGGATTTIGSLEHANPQETDNRFAGIVVELHREGALLFGTACIWNLFPVQIKYSPSAPRRITIPV